jgi:DNA-binding LacI/PurR family transcriptional regulator
MSKKPVQTLDDLARLANVSKSTASRALNNSPLLSQETRERVQALARQHNFRINAPARNLRLRQSHSVAFVVPACHANAPSGEDPFLMEIMAGVGAGLHELGYDLLVVYVNPRDTTWAHNYLESGRVDGFIILASSRKLVYIKTLQEIGAPFIVWGVPSPGYSHCSVTGDNIAGGLLATRHLIGSGRQRIAFLGGEETDASAQQRFAGYERALQEAGRSLDPALVTYGDYSYDSGAAAMQRLLQQSPALDAVFVNSDLMAIAAINTIQSLGKRVPEEIAVVGYDDLPIAVYNSLPLTTIRQNIPLGGKLLAQNLIQTIQTGVITNVTLPVELVIRKSA